MYSTIFRGYFVQQITGAGTILTLGTIQGREEFKEIIMVYKIINPRRMCEGYGVMSEWGPLAQVPIFI